MSQTIIPDEYDVYRTYEHPYQSWTSAPAGVLNVPQVGSTPPGQNAFQPPRYPSGPQVAPPPPRKRPGRAGAILLLTLVLALIFGVGLFAGWEFANNKSSTTSTSQAASTTPAESASSNSLQTQMEAAIAKVEPSVVELKVTTAQGEQIGSGVIIDANGDIITNNHVVSGEQSIQVGLYNGSMEQGQLVGTVAADDLAVVRIQPFAHMTVVQIGSSSQLTVGQEVLAIGNPLGITETVTHGIVSALNRSVTESAGTTISNAVQTDTPINPGNSGGALINLQGQLVGIPTLTAIDPEFNTAANGVSFAIPSSLVQSALRQLLH